jgi:hypothetical protein
VRRRLLLVGLVLLLAIPLTLALRNFARDVIVVPVLYILWLGHLLVQSIPQGVLWALLLLIALVISARSLSKGRSPAGKVREAWADCPGQVAAWARQIHRMTRGSYYEWSLAQHLAKLSLAVLAYRERLTREQIKQHLQAGKLDMPPEIQAYVQAGLSPFLPNSPSLLSRLVHRLRQSVRTSPLAVDLEKVVRFLEKQLEV